MGRQQTARAMVRGIQRRMRRGRAAGGLRGSPGNWLQGMVQLDRWGKSPESPVHIVLFNTASDAGLCTTGDCPLPWPDVMSCTYASCENWSLKAALLQDIDCHSSRVLAGHTHYTPDRTLQALHQIDIELALLHSKQMIHLQPTVQAPPLVCCMFALPELEQPAIALNVAPTGAKGIPLCKNCQSTHGLGRRPLLTAA